MCKLSYLVLSMYKLSYTSAGVIYISRYKDWQERYLKKNKNLIILETLYKF